MRREIWSSFGAPFPKIPGVEVFAEGEKLPERTRLEQAVFAVCQQYGVGLPVPAPRSADETEAW